MYMRAYIHTYIYLYTGDAVPNLPIHRQPILQRLLESRACMLMIARRGLYLFHLICAPGGHGSCNDGRGGRRELTKREKKDSEEEKERKRERKKLPSSSP